MNMPSDTGAQGAPDSLIQTQSVEKIKDVLIEYSDWHLSKTTSVPYLIIAGG